MTDETVASSGGNDISVVSLPADAPESFDSEHSAARYFATLHEKKPEKQAAESAEAATADPELSGEDNAAPLDEAHGEDQEIDPAQPPIDRPKSWTEAEDAEWRSTPRALQQKIVARELERDTAIRRAQNEAAEKLKGLTAKEQQAEQARQQYEAQLPALMQALQDANAGAFGDIKNIDDVTKLVNEDPFRYLQWQAHQQKMAAVNGELDRANGEKSKAEQSDWNTFVQKENALAAELIPDLADKEKGPALMKRAAERLADLGFKSDELNDHVNGKQKLSILDHRFQRLVADSLELAQIKSAKAVVARPDLPPVQRPGTARPQGSTASERAQAFDKSLTNSGDLKDAVALLQARRGRRTA